MPNLPPDQFATSAPPDRHQRTAPGFVGQGETFGEVRSGLTGKNSNGIAAFKTPLHAALADF